MTETTAVTKKPTRRRNAASEAARALLIELSVEAKKMIPVLQATTGEEWTVNKVLIRDYQQSTGASDFRTFKAWKEAGYSVKKGEKAFRVWGSPVRGKKKKAADSDVEQSQENEADNEYKMFPMCCLFHQGQVEKMDDGNGSDEIETVSDGKSTSDQHHVLDLGNNELLTRGLFPQSDGSFIAMTYTESRDFKTQAGALAWLADRGLDAAGNRLDAVTNVDDGVDEQSPSPFVMVDFVERQDARRAHLNAKAADTRKASEQAFETADRRASVIPFGQPILVGHHSEGRDRRYREGIRRQMDKGFELRNKAQHQQQRAASVGKGGIASNDPDALTKLDDKLQQLVKRQDHMKAVNKIAKARNLDDAAKVAELVAAELLSAESAQQILEPDFGGRVGYPSYELTNNNAEIRRIKKRIEELEALRNSAPLEFENDDFSVAIDNGQVVIDFCHGKPSQDVRTKVGRSGFTFSRSRGVWVRKATANAVATAEQLTAWLNGVENIY